MNQREQVRVREDLAEDFEGLFAPAHAGEPVVNERDAQHPIIARQGSIIGYAERDPRFGDPARGDQSSGRGSVRSVARKQPPGWARYARPSLQTRTRKLFQARTALKQAVAQETSEAAPKTKIVCGMMIVEADPSLDPKMAVTPPQDQKLRYAIRVVRAADL